jgi:hypothetical protein
VFLCSTNEKGEVTGDLQIVYIKIVYRVLGYLLSVRISEVLKIGLICMDIF